MQIVYAHYHLNRGGVTQVIVNQIRALASLPREQWPQRVGVLYGGRHDGWPKHLWPGDAPFEVELLPLTVMDYNDADSAQPEKLAKYVARLLEGRGFAADDTLLHVHNHSVGKNVGWPGALHVLASKRYRMILQLHDLIEDYRPVNFRQLMWACHCRTPRELAAILYPQSPGIQYVVLTERDADLLRRGGIPDDRMTLLPNPIGECAVAGNAPVAPDEVRRRLGLEPQARLVVYPVRCIRRKNLGEVLLLAALSNPDTWFSLSLAPNGDHEQASHDRWHRLADELGLRVLFDSCSPTGVDFPSAVAASDALVTTSVAEGFGMVYLESWLAGKPLIGRNLPSITADATAMGLKLDHLYDKLSIPLDWIGGTDAVSEALELTYQWAASDYGLEPVSRRELEPQLAALFADNVIDFAHLPTRFQERIIRRVAHDHAASLATLCELNPQLATNLAIDASVSHETIASNARVVREEFSLAKMASRLGDLYTQVNSRTAGRVDDPLPHGDALLRTLLTLPRLHPLRLET